MQKNTSTLIEATKEDAATIAAFVREMIVEVGEFSSDSVLVVDQTVGASFQENVHWFLFVDENGKPFGTCFCQSLFNYWSTQKRYHFGAFYIAPSHRRQGRSQEIYGQMKAWVQKRDARSLFCFIHEDNAASRKTFEKAGCEFAEEVCFYNDAFPTSCA